MTYVGDGLLAAPALGIEQIAVALFTIGQTILLVEVALFQWRGTVSALEATRMPHFVQRIDGFLCTQEYNSKNG